MKNTLLTYTTILADGREVKQTVWTTWHNANKTAEALLLDTYMTEVIKNMTATWYDEDGRPLLYRQYIVGNDFFTGELTLLVKDTDY
jgi:hypothetical protein